MRFVQERLHTRRDRGLGERRENPTVLGTARDRSRLGGTRAMGDLCRLMPDPARGRRREDDRHRHADSKLTAEDVNELCRRLIDGERERTQALLTELLIQICDNAIPEVVSRLPELRGPPGPVGPAGKLPIVEEWARETVFYEGSVVSYEGGSYQALRDTGEPPDNEAHWKCLAAPGRDGKSIRHRGTFKEDSEYTAYDAVAHNGASFLALHSKPGPCPGPGWQLLSAPGKRGVAGERGPQGDRGPVGIAGLPGKDAATIGGWAMDRSAYTVTPVMSDGSSGPPLNLRGLFEQFVNETDW
jgi:hypothetical protein